MAGRSEVVWHSPVGESDDGEESGDGPGFKLAVVARCDLAMSAGKLAAQVGHAVHDAVVAASKEKLAGWEADGSRIIVLQVEGGQRGLRSIAEAARTRGLVLSTVEDEGLTEIEHGAWTAVAVGPDEVDNVDDVTGHLSIYRDSLQEQLEAAHQRIRELEAALQDAGSPGVGGTCGGGGSGAGGRSRLGWRRPSDRWFAMPLGARWLDPEAAPDPGVPELFEQWCWEGDLAVLPAKWQETLEAAASGAPGDALAPAPACRPWESRSFDPEGVFFITHRSHTCGVACALLLDDGDECGVDGSGSAAQLGRAVVFVAVRPDFRKRGIGRCLLRLCCLHHARSGQPAVRCAVGPMDGTPHGARELLQAEGFRETDL